MFLLSFGLFASHLWGTGVGSRHIHDKFSDAIAVTAPSNAPKYPDPDREISREFHLGAFCARHAQRFGSRRVLEFLLVDLFQF